MLLPFAAATALSCACCCAAAESPRNLLANGDFAATAEGAPAGWRIGSPGHTIAVDPAEKPDGPARSLRVDIRSTSPNYGEVQANLTGLDAAGTYLIEGKVKATARGLAFLQIKLYRDGKELRRITTDRNGTGWTTVGTTFRTGGADKVGILCRFLQAPEAVGQTVWFADVKVTRAPPPPPREPSAVATFCSLGLYVPFGAAGSGGSCRVRYRSRGSGAWRVGMDLVPCEPEDEFRGSLFLLAPNTDYEVEATVVDAAGKPQPPVRLTGRTWAEDVPVGRTCRLPAGVSTTPLVIAEKGTPGAWVLYAPPDGATATIDAGTAADHAVLIENAEYVILRNVTVRGGRKDCISVVRSHHVRVQRCDVTGWGDPGTRKEGLEKGLYVDARGRVINMQAGVRVRDGSRQVVVEDNFIHDPRGTANSWGHGHPAGPQGVILSSTGGNNVVRNNDLIGCERHWWNDAIEGAQNSAVDGGPYRDSDLHGNVLAFSNDDGTELDGGQINVRYWHNWIDKALCGVSCAPNRRGPSYVFGNLIVLTGEERLATGAGFKMGGDRFPNPGLSLLLHNTVYTTGQGLTSGHYGTGPTPMRTRNNVFFGPQDGYGRIRYRHRSGGDFDYDLLPAGGVYGLSPPPKDWEAHGVTARPSVRDESARDFRLAEGSPGLDAGLRLPGLNDGFAGAGPDLGAFERGRDGDPLFPPRPSGLSALPMRVDLGAVTGDELPKATVTLRAPPAAGRSWRAIPNSPWLSCTPSSGPAAEAPQQVTVTLAGRPEEVRLHRGAVTFRTDTGLNRTVMVDAKVYPRPLVAIWFEAEAGAITGGLEKLPDPTASGGAYVQAPETLHRAADGTEQRIAADGAVTFDFDLPADGVYHVVARCMVPLPAETAGLHDSFRFRLDGGAEFLWHVPNGALGRWQWQRVGSREPKTDPVAAKLTKGRHRLTIRSREALTRLDALAITNSPYPEPPPIPPR